MFFTESKEFFLLYFISIHSHCIYSENDQIPPSNCLSLSDLFHVTQSCHDQTSLSQQPLSSFFNRWLVFYFFPWNFISFFPKMHCCSKSKLICHLFHLASIIKVAYKQQKFISPCRKDWEIRGQGAGKVVMHPPGLYASHCAFVWQKGQGILWSLCYEFLFLRAPPSWHHTPLKASLLVPSSLRLEFHHIWRQ